MADVKKIATRESYGNALKALGGEVTDLVVLDADLAGATKTNIFQKAYPDRFFDCGIAEANMVGVAAGLATGRSPSRPPSPCSPPVVLMSRSATPSATPT